MRKLFENEQNGYLNEGVFSFKVPGGFEEKVEGLGRRVEGMEKEVKQMEKRVERDINSNH